MLEFKVACTYICTTIHDTHYKIFYSKTIVYMLTLGYDAAEKNSEIKPNQRNHTTLK